MEPPQLTPRAPKAAYGESDNSTAQPPSTIYLDDKQPILVTRSPPTAKFTQGAAGPKPRLRDALDRALEYMGTASGLVSAVWFGTTVLTVNIGTYYAVKALIPSGVTSAFDYFVHGAKDMGLSDAAIYAAMNMLGVFLLFSVFCVSAQRTVTRAVTERSYEYFASVNQLPRGTDVSAFEGSARLYAVFCGGGCCDLRTLVYLVLFNVMYYFMILIGLALLVVPGVIAAIGLSIAPAIIVVEGVGPITAISRCWALLREKKLRSFQYWLLYLCITAVAVVASRLIAVIVIALGNSFRTPETENAWTIATVVIYSVVVYFAAGFSSIFLWSAGASYYHHRIVKAYYDSTVRGERSSSV